MGVVWPWRSFLIPAGYRGCSPASPAVFLSIYPVTFSNISGTRSTTRLTVSPGGGATGRSRTAPSFTTTHAMGITLPPAPRAAAQEEEALPALQPVDLGELCTDERAQKITAFLTGLLQHMGSSAQVKVYQPEEGRYKVILEGEKLGQLIGRRGETLDAIQQLTNYSINRGGEKRVRIHVDAENYRLKREQSLQHLARKVAAKVVKYRRNVTLEPMNAYERHVIHTALQDVPGVTTYSMGTDPNRRVIVAYDRSAAR